MVFFGNYSGLTVFWVVVIVALIAAELATFGLTTIWFVAGALVALICSMLHVSLVIQVILFIAVSLAMLLLIRPYAVKHFNPGRSRTNVDSYLGRQGIVTDEIDNLAQKGSVKVDGMDWSARSTINEVVLPKGVQVTVRGVDGVKLIVEESTMHVQSNNTQGATSRDPG